MRTTPLTVSMACAALFLIAMPARAQYAPVQGDQRSIGERYYVEVGADFWGPAPVGVVRSESLGIPGTDVDLVSDFGVTKRRFRQLQLFLRPAKKHKFRLVYTPIRYAADATLEKASAAVADGELPLFVSDPAERADRTPLELLVASPEAGAAPVEEAPPPAADATAVAELEQQHAAEIAGLRADYETRIAQLRSGMGREMAQRIRGRRYRPASTRK